MTVTIIVDGEIWFQSNQVEDLWIVDGVLTVLEANENWKAIEREKVDQLLVTSY